MSVAITSSWNQMKRAKYATFEHLRWEHFFGRRGGRLVLGCTCGFYFHSFPFLDLLHSLHAFFMEGDGLGSTVDGMIGRHLYTV